MTKRETPVRRSCARAPADLASGLSMAATSISQVRVSPTRAAALVPGLAVAGWGLLVLGGHLLGARLQDADPLVHIGAPPLVGRYEVAAGWWLLAAIAFAALAVAWAPALAQRLRWPGLLAACWAGAAAWAALLALADGPSALTAPLETRYEYLAVLDRVGSTPGAFLQGYVAHLPEYPTHVKGHPPAFVLFFWAFAQVGLGGSGVAAALVICIGALAAPAAVVTVRAIAGEALARQGAPLLALTPAAVWMATSADGLLLGLTACAIAAIALGLAGSDRAALGGGALLGAALFCSYGVLPLGAVVLALGWLRRDRVLRVFALVAAAIAVVVALFAAAGFWWPDGLAATRELYAGGVASRRPYLDFLVISLAAFALVVGPAAAAGLARVPVSLRVLVLGGLCAVLAADASGLSRGETERIWLLFAPWVLCAAVALGARRRWLAAQLGLALAVQVAVRSPW